MKKIIFLILISSVFAFSQDAVLKNNKHMIGVDVSTLTGSGLMYRLLDGGWGFKASAYAISSSKEKENSYAVGLSVQRNIILKPLTRLYALAGTSFRQQNFDRSTDYTKNYFNFGAGFGVEARALQAVKNEDIIFFFEVGEKYFSINKISESQPGGKVLDSGLIPFFTAGCGIEF